MTMMMIQHLVAERSDVQRNDEDGLSEATIIIIWTGRHRVARRLKHTSQCFQQGFQQGLEHCHKLQTPGPVVVQGLLAGVSMLYDCKEMRSPGFFWSNKKEGIEYNCVFRAVN